jgi:Tol biopolymer transport system component
MHKEIITIGSAIILAVLICNCSDNRYVIDRTVVLADTHEYGPKWSPDGNYILFYGSKFLNTPGGGNAGVYVEYPWSISAIDVNKMEPIPIYSSDKGDKYPDWYTGEDSIVFSSWKSIQARNRLYAYYLYEEEPYRLTDTKGPYDENYPVYSNTSGKIAFSANFNGGFDIWELKPGGEPALLISTPGYDTYPEWSPDGKEILFTSDDGGSWNIWKADFNGDNKTNLTGPRAFNSNNLYSSWGEARNLIAFSSDRSGSWDIWVTEPDGSNPTRITDDPADEVAPTWSPDGTKLAYQTDEYGTWDIGIVSFIE